MRPRCEISRFQQRCLRGLVALVTAGALGCGGSDSSTRAADADVDQIVRAFNMWENLPPSCQGVIDLETLRMAIAPSTGVQWAIAAFRPVSDCSYSLEPEQPGGPRRVVRIEQIGPWGRVPQPPIGVFQRPPGKQWDMNSEGGHPFPCPAPAGIAPGPGIGALPAEVLAIWDLSYADGCENVSWPMQSRAP